MCSSSDVADDRESAPRGALRVAITLICVGLTAPVYALSTDFLMIFGGILLLAVESTLIAAWGGLAPQSLAVRLPVAMVLAFAASVAIDLPVGNGGSFPIALESIILVFPAAILGQVPLGVFRYGFGWRLVRRGRPSDLESPSFSLRYLLGLIVVMALFFAANRTGGIVEFRLGVWWRAYAGFSGMITIMVLASLPVIWLSLLLPPTRALCWTALYSIPVITGYELALLALGEPGSGERDTVWRVSVGFLHFELTALILLYLRRYGLQLVRVGCGGGRVTHECGSWKGR